MIKRRALLPSYQYWLWAFQLLLSSLTMSARRLNLLSLDGGGVRGLSSLYILQRIMTEIDPSNPPKPCEYFDLI